MVLSVSVAIYSWPWLVLVNPQHKVTEDFLFVPTKLVDWLQKFTCWLWKIRLGKDLCWYWGIVEWMRFVVWLCCYSLCLILFEYSPTWEVCVWWDLLWNTSNILSFWLKLTFQARNFLIVFSEFIHMLKMGKFSDEATENRRKLHNTRSIIILNIRWNIQANPHSPDKGLNVRQIIHGNTEKNPTVTLHGLSSTMVHICIYRYWY